MSFSIKIPKVKLDLDCYCVFGVKKVAVSFATIHFICTNPTGSMGVERATKPLKVAVYTKQRNRLESGNKKMLLRTGLNLRFLSGTKFAMNTSLNKSNSVFFFFSIWNF